MGRLCQRPVARTGLKLLLVRGALDDVQLACHHMLLSPCISMP